MSLLQVSIHLTLESNQRGSIVFSDESYLALAIPSYLESSIFLTTQYFILIVPIESGIYDIIRVMIACLEIIWSEAS